MRLLFDGGVPHELADHLKPYQIETVQKKGWAKLKNGVLLQTASKEFDVLITTDSNMKYQQDISKHQIGVIVLRAFDNKLDSYLRIVPGLLDTVLLIRPGDAIYLYADEKLREIDKRKGKL